MYDMVSCRDTDDPSLVAVRAPHHGNMYAACGLKKHTFD